MVYSSPVNRLKKLYRQLYPHTADNQLLLHNFLATLPLKPFSPSPSGSLKDICLYALYVDQFAKNFDGLIKKLDHIVDLGCNALWLLPILKSPGLDQGFDISDYLQVDSKLGGNPAFFKFLTLARQKKLPVIFDISINHSSDQHLWFKESKKSPTNPYRHYYLWSDTPDKYTHYQDEKGQLKANRVIFPHDPADQNLNPQNPRQKWVFDPQTRQYYYRTFYKHQPDLNYQNPQVLLEMSQVIVFWAKKGVSGFRADAAPFLWKIDGYKTESLPQTHLILKFFQTVAAVINPQSFIIAEACQPPQDLLAYLKPDECRLAYHFPRMNCLWQTLISQTKTSLIKDIQATPKINKLCQWLIFLRLHDELSLEMCSPATRQTIHSHLIENGLDFRNGHGVSGRLTSFLRSNPQQILLAWALLLTQPGSPLIFQGDEVAETNHHQYYRQMKRLTGEDDTRFLNRGPIDWQNIDQQLKDKTTLAFKIYYGLKKMLKIWQKYHFGRADLKLVDLKNSRLFACYRQSQAKKVFCLFNLSSKPQTAKLPFKPFLSSDLLNQKLDLKNSHLTLKPFAFYWLKI